MTEVIVEPVNPRIVIEPHQVVVTVAPMGGVTINPTQVIVEAGKGGVRGPPGPAGDAGDRRAWLTAAQNFTSSTMTPINGMDLPFEVGRYAVRGAFLFSFPIDPVGAQFGVLLGEGITSDFSWISLAAEACDTAFTDELRGVVVDFDNSPVIGGVLAQQPLYILRIHGFIEPITTGYLRPLAANYTGASGQMRIQHGSHWQLIPYPDA